ncbi:MAG: heparinase II/III family protein [Deltaproteobacteria bacterium]|nr:heparinase II/III family protein [Deltaproteobacteria bacterium]
MQIKSARPRIIIDTEDIERIRESVKTYGKEDFDFLLESVRNNVGVTSPQKLASDRNSLEIMMNLVFAALISQDDTLIRQSVSSGTVFAKTDPDSGDDMAQRNRLLVMSLVYDWLYRSMSDEQRLEIKKGIISHIEHLRYFADRANFTGGHTRYGNAVILAGLIALADDYGDWAGYKLLDKVRDNWVKGYNPYQSYAARDGGYYMGWTYGTGYTSPLPYLLWEKATGEHWCDDWRRNQIYWYLYGLRGDETYPRAGDCYSTASPYASDGIKSIVAVCAGLYKNPHAEWFYQEYLSKGAFRIWRIIYRDPMVTPQSPYDRENTLPFSRRFDNSGCIIARDSWNKDATQLFFKCSPFYTLNHHHKDQNHFSLSYKGPLIIDSGYYDHYGSNHWLNYYTRSIAHNTLVVHDPDEVFHFAGRTISNDGGQKFADYNQQPLGEEPRSLEEALSKKYNIGGITCYQTNGKSCWIRGDAGNAYSESKLKTYERDILFIGRPSGRDHPCVMILDRVALNKNLTPRILFHTEKKPDIKNQGCTVRNNGGGLVHMDFMGTPEANIRLIGGHGAKWLVDGKNYPPQGLMKNEHTEAGSWRIEISTAHTVKNASFLTLLTIDDVSSSPKKPNVSRVSGDGYEGAIIGDDLLIIFYGKSAPDDWHFTGDRFNNIKEVHIAGVDSQRRYSFHLNDCTYTSGTPEVHEYHLP